MCRHVAALTAGNRSLQSSFVAMVYANGALMQRNQNSTIQGSYAFIRRALSTVVESRLSALERFGEPWREPQAQMRRAVGAKRYDLHIHSDIASRRLVDQGDLTR